MLSKLKIHYICNEENSIELIVSDNSMLSYPLHTHSSVITIAIVLKGEIFVCVNNIFYKHSKNEIFKISPDVPHSIEVKSTYSLLTLCIKKELLQNLDLKIMEESIMKILSYVIELKYIDKDQAICLINSIKSFYVAEMGHKKTEIDKLKLYLENFPESRISIEDMSHYTYTSKYHMIRSFKKKIGLTPHQFQLQNRIRKAQKLLYQNNTITEVALTTGFCDQSHFIKQFEKIVGLTPTVYKHSCVILKN